MVSFKNGLRVYTTSNAINDALMADFSSQNGPKIGPKSLPNWFQRALERALNEDSDSKLKKCRWDSKTPAILEGKSVQNRVQTASKSNQIGFQTQSYNRKRFNNDFI